MSSSMPSSSSTTAPDASALRVRDLTDPAQGPHAMQLIVDELTRALTDAWRTSLKVVRRDPITTVADNYEALGYPPDAVTRGARHTRYVDETRLWRSASTAMIPGVLRELAVDQPDDVLIAAPGVCYRRDSVDWQHTGTPQQMDLWRIRKESERALDIRDLVEMIGLVVATALPGRRWRTIPKTHPYTEAGRQIDVAHHGEWVEIGECGLAGPKVLADAGVEGTGLAMGLGMDRLLLLRKGIPDIRLLRSNDPRVSEQMLDLAPYRPVSHMPPIRRDLSIAVDPGVRCDAEALGDRVRKVLGDDAESLDVLAISPYDEVPPKARERLGMAPDQRNVLLRLVLRPLDRTLTDDEANALRDKAYAELQDGSVHTWAAR